MLSVVKNFEKVRRASQLTSGAFPRACVCMHPPCTLERINSSIGPESIIQSADQRPSHNPQLYMLDCAMVWDQVEPAKVSAKARFKEDLSLDSLDVVEVRAYLRVADDAPCDD